MGVMKTEAQNLQKRERGRPLEIEWQESEIELKTLYNKEVHAGKRVRLHALWLLRKGKRLSEISDVLDVSYRTLQRWVRWYREGGLPEVLDRTNGRGGGQLSYLSDEQKSLLRAKVDEGAFRTGEEATEWIESQWGIRYKAGSIYSLFRQMGIKKKVPRRQSDKADPAEQDAWKKGGLPKP